MAKLLRIAPEFPATNLQKALEYYQDKLGFRLVMQTPDGEYAIVERDDVAIHLFQHRSETVSPMGIHIFTSDLEALHDEFHEKGAYLTQDILRKPWGNRDFRLRDEFGNEIKFTEPLAED